METYLHTNSAEKNSNLAVVALFRDNCGKFSLFKNGYLKVITFSTCFNNLYFNLPVGYSFSGNDNTKIPIFYSYTSILFSRFTVEYSELKQCRFGSGLHCLGLQNGETKDEKGDFILKKGDYKSETGDLCLKSGDFCFKNEYSKSKQCRPEPGLHFIKSN